MPQDRSGPGPENPDDGSDSHRASTNQHLEEARAAADLARQWARLSEEYARLSRNRYEQSSGTASPPVPDEPQQPPACEAGSPFYVQGVERWKQLAHKRGRPRRSAAVRSSRHRAPSHGRRDRNWKGIALSTALHLSLLVLLGLLTVAIRPEPQIDTIIASFAEDEEAPTEEEVPIEQPLEEIRLEEPHEEPGEQQDDPAPPEEQEPPDEAPEEPAAENPDDPPLEPMPPVEPVEIAEAPDAMMKPDPAAEPVAEADIDLAEVGNRSAEGKAFLLKKFGGTPESEAAVSRALEWFAKVQRRDGSWNFNDVGPASHAGKVNNPMGATSYVLLAYLGAGHTHHEGDYRRQVGRAINFLIKHHRLVRAGADFRSPNVEEHHNFYVQGAAAMALCEAHAMTGDRRLRVPAQRAIDFIVAAQDPQNGGWRYKPFEPGCTSVTTLQLTALISARRGAFKVPPKTLEGISHYYDTVQCDGAPTGRYCYRAAEPRYQSASTAQAALGRMYLGVTRDDEDLTAAVALLDERGPYDNRYYCYYATQVMKNWGGPEWDRWNQSMRDELVRTQVAEEGPALGSWTPLQRGIVDTAGGRLFTTALSTMTLEVYYRYLPLYEVFDDEPDDDGDAKMAEGGEPEEE